MLEFNECVDMIVPSVGIDILYRAAAEYAYELTSRFKGLRIVSLASIDPSLHKIAYESLQSAGVSSYIEGHSEYFIPDVQHLGMRFEDLCGLPGALSMPLGELEGMIDKLHEHKKFIVRDIYSSMSVFGLGLIISEHGSRYIAERLSTLNLFLHFQFESEFTFLVN